MIRGRWQVLAEEKATTTQLREWATKDYGEATGGRFDFLALEGRAQLIVIEIKRSGIAVTLEEAQGLEVYNRDLARAHTNVVMVLISGGDYQFDTEDWKNRGVLLPWRDVYERARVYYDHYRAVLEGDVESPDFRRKEIEVAQTREVIAGGVYRGEAGRLSGLGPQDVDVPEFTPSKADETEGSAGKVPDDGSGPEA